MYVDSLATCFNNEKSAFSFYENSWKMVVLGGLDLCKWFTNYRQLQDKIFETENTESDHTFDVNTTKNTFTQGWICVYVWWNCVFVFYCNLVKAGPSSSKNIFVICFIESFLKLMKNAFYFVLKAYFILKIFTFLSWLLVM